MTHGGFGYAKEFHVERYLREVLIPRIAPVSPQLALSFIAERCWGWRSRTRLKPGLYGRIDMNLAHHLLRAAKANASAPALFKD